MRIANKLKATRGTPGYRAPEQIDGDETDPRTDLFSLGIVLLEVLFGHPLAGSGDLDAIGLSQRVRAICTTVNASPSLTALLLQMTAAEPALRPDSAAAAHRWFSSILLGTFRPRTDDLFIDGGTVCAEALIVEERDADEVLSADSLIVEAHREDEPIILLTKVKRRPRARMDSNATQIEVLAFESM